MTGSFLYIVAVIREAIWHEEWIEVNVKYIVLFNFYVIWFLKAWRPQILYLNAFRCSGAWHICMCFTNNTWCDVYMKRGIHVLLHTMCVCAGVSQSGLFPVLFWFKMPWYSEPIPISVLILTKCVAVYILSKKVICFMLKKCMQVKKKILFFIFI